MRNGKKKNSPMARETSTTSPEPLVVLVPPLHPVSTPRAVARSGGWGCCVRGRRQAPRIHPASRGSQRWYRGLVVLGLSFTLSVLERYLRAPQPRSPIAPCFHPTSSCSQRRLGVLFVAVVKHPGSTLRAEA